MFITDEEEKAMEVDQENVVLLQVMGCRKIERSIVYELRKFALSDTLRNLIIAHFCICLVATVILGAYIGRDKRV